ncbi:MAG TPA: YidB family protein [Casimicrobiaceae bacterium]
MGLLDGLLGSVMGGMLGGGGQQQQGVNPLLQIALQMLQQNGGLQGILGKAQQAGYGEQVQSWIGTGQNLPIDAGALSQIFGQGQLGQIAQQLGMSREETAGQLAQTLPQVVDQMTPEGQIPENHSDLVNQALAILQSRSG